MKRSLKFFQSIYFKIPVLFVFILLIAFQIIGVFFIEQLESQTVRTFKTQIRTQVDFLANNVSPILADRELSDEDRRLRLNQTLETFSTTDRTEIQIINTEEYVVATNYGVQQNAVGTKTNDPTIKNVLVNQRSFAEQTYNTTTGQHTYNLMKAVVVPDTNEVVGVVAISANMNNVYAQTNSVVQLFVQSAGLAIIVTFVIAIVLSQGLTRPIENMRQQAIRISEGVYNLPAKVYGQDELGELARTINELSIKVKDAQELTESERQRLDGVLRHMTDGVIATDRRGTILLVNERALGLLHREREQLLGMPILELLQMDNTHTLRDLLKQDAEALITQERGEDSALLKVEFSVIRRDTGFVTGLVCVLTDVTEQERTEQERREFVSNVSHELRTPLTSIKSYTDALIEGAWEDENVAPQFLNVIQSETNRMIRMVGNLLDLSKMDAGQYVLQTEYIDFVRFINHIVDRFEFMIQNDETQKRYVIEREITSRLIYVEIDQDRMTQVVDNIINNAIKYSPDGGTIHIKVEESHDRIVLSIRDHGLGIPQKDLPHLFDRFYRVDKARSREQGGTGLGLAISKEVVELHGGRIWVTSSENEGSTFSVELPYSAMDDFDEGWDFV